MFLRLILPVVTVICEEFKYDGDVPYLPYSFSSDLSNSRNATVKIDQEITFFLSSNCSTAGSCTTSNHDDILGPPSGAQEVPNSDFIVPINGERLFGSGVKGPLTTPLTSDPQTTLNIVNRSSKPIDLIHDGVLAFGFRESVAKSNLAKKIFEKLDRKQIIFRRGPFEQTLKDKQINKTKGVFATGEDNIDGCGEFVYKKTVPYRGWTVRANIKIADKTYAQSWVTFSLDQPTGIPGTAFWQFDKKSEKDLPDLTLDYGSQNYTLRAENMKQFEGPNHNQFKLFFKTQIELQFILGSNFLSDYCIALRTNDDMTQAEVGLAPVIKLSDDPQWESY